MPFVSTLVCSSALLLGNIDSSHHYRIWHEDDLSRKGAETIINDIAMNLCGKSAGISSSHCKNIELNNPYTKVCVVQSRFGYFFLMKDMLDGVNIVFNRWD